MRIVGLLLLLLGVVTSSAHADEATKFNGFHVNMTRQEILASKPAKYVGGNGKNPAFILFRDPAIPDFMSKEGKGCAAFDMEGDKIAKMSLRKCFFGAEDMPPEQFAKSVMKAYGINASCKMRLMPDRSVEPFCSGTTDKGEVVEIDTAGISIERMRQKPRFN